MTDFHTLRISPKFSSSDWAALDDADPGDWSRAVAMLRDRLHGRFIKFVDEWIEDPFSGFVVLSIDCLLAETIQQFREGYVGDRGSSLRHIVDFLSGSRFRHDFDSQARVQFYKDIRCGLLHQAEAREMWVVRRNQETMLQKITGTSGHGYILDVRRFHIALRDSLDDYCSELIDPDRHDLRTNLWRKMGEISRTREARGLLYESEPN